MFAIQTCCKDCEKTVGNSPREISRLTEYLIDKGTKITAKLPSIHYRRLPLFQGGLEIACEVTVTIPVSIKGHLLMQRCEKMVHGLYCEPKNETIMGSFTENINVDFDIQPKRKRKKTLEKLFKNPKGAKTFDLSSKKDNVKKIHLCK